jgi:SAM-dependent methyltransferase
MPVLHGPIYPVMASALELRPDDDLLEVACGSGIFLDQHAGPVHFVAGLDLSDIQVDLARRRLAARIAAATAEIVKGDVSALPWPDGRFSVATCMGSFEAFPDPARAVAEIYRVLRPGGRIVLNIGERVTEGTQTHQILSAIWVWSEDDVRRMVEHAGFTDITIRYASSSGDSRLLAISNRLGGADQLRLVSGIKAWSPAPAP